MRTQLKLIRGNALALLVAMETLPDLECTGRRTRADIKQPTEEMSKQTNHLVNEHFVEPIRAID